MQNGLLKILFLFLIAVLAGWSIHRYVLTQGEALNPPQKVEKKDGKKAVPDAMTVMASAVRASPAETRDIPVTLSAVGTLEAEESAGVSAEVAGSVSAIYFNEGAPVKKGDPLVQIDDSLIRAELMKAEAAHDVKKKTFSRSSGLKATGYISNQDWDQNKSELREAEANIEMARIRIEKARTKSPFDGVAGLRSVSVGDYVQAGQLLATVDMVDPVKITFSVPEKVYADIRSGQKITFSVDAWPDEIFDGTVYAVSPRINPNTRHFDVRATAPNKAARLSPGMFARVTVVTTVHEGAIAVPERAILPMGNDSFVFVVRDGKAVLQKVSTGLRVGGAVEVAKGLTGNESVITDGMMKLQDGTPVRVENQ
jgi:membrane fusion protein (multidrug efflux system)